jgi:hypothetical protein
MKRKSVAIRAAGVASLLLSAMLSPAWAASEEVRTICLFEAFDVRPRLNAPQIEAYVANCIADATAAKPRKRRR